MYKLQNQNSGKNLEISHFRGLKNPSGYLTLSCLPIYPVSSLTVFYHKMGYHNDLHISLEVLKELQPNFTEMWLRHQAFIKR